MRQRVYLETTIISLLASRPRRDVIQLAHQETTREWWGTRSGSFDLFLSQLVLDEVRDGNRGAASRRAAVVQGLPILRGSDEASALGEALVAQGGIPREASNYAMHLALASFYAMDFLLTWNCRHLANAEMVGFAASVVIDHGFRPPRVCTPEQLLGAGAIRCDPVMEEIRGVKEQIAAQYGYDVRKLAQSLMREQAENGRKVVSPSRRAPSKK
jgi:hypothetical protein